MLEQGGRGREAAAGGRGRKANCRLLLVFSYLVLGSRREKLDTIPFLLLVSSSLLPLLPIYLPLYWLVSLLCSSLSALFSTFSVDIQYAIPCHPHICCYLFFLHGPIMPLHGVAAQSRP